MDGSARDVFIVHTKGDTRERALSEVIVPRLASVRISVWQYADWAWTHRRPRGDGGKFRSDGLMSELDLTLLAAGHPTPFRARVTEAVDEESLAGILRASNVVLLCEPRGGEPSEGVLTERRVLARVTAGPTLVRLVWSDTDRGFFDAVRPSVDVCVGVADTTPEATDEAFAAVAAAWLVSQICQRGGEAGCRLLARVRIADRYLRTIVERTPRFADANIRRQSADDLRPGRDAAGEQDAEGEAAVERLVGRVRAVADALVAKRFEQWWREGTVELRSAAARLGTSGPYSTALRVLLETSDASYREVLGVPDPRV